ncbi:MAG: hypothetical protein M3Y37_01215, partial [Chloroflexota bacterium]|nr:hypothetical protein [Chloroflexota bacterium]
MTSPDPEQTAPAEPAGSTEDAESFRPSNATSWATPVDKLNLDRDMPDPGMANNITGRRVTSPIQGFGRMWHKVHRVSLDGVDISPTELIAEWKANFGSFWPKGNRFYGPLTGLEPGEIAVLNIGMPGGQRLSTGVLVLYADDESFTLM